MTANDRDGRVHVGLSLLYPRVFLGISRCPSVARRAHPGLPAYLRALRTVLFGQFWLHEGWCMGRIIGLQGSSLPIPTAAVPEQWFMGISTGIPTASTLVAVNYGTVRPRDP